MKNLFTIALVAVLGLTIGCTESGVFQAAEMETPQDSLSYAYGVQLAEMLKQQNKNLQNQISSLNNEKSRLQAEISELNNSIQSLKEITLEQIRVILDLANQLKEIIYEKIFSPTIQL